MSITIDPDLWDRVKARAKAENRSTSNLVEWLLQVAMGGPLDREIRDNIVKVAQELIDKRAEVEHDEGEAEAT